MNDIVIRLCEFAINEARSCSMDMECITPLYVYLMWDESVPIDETAMGLAELRKLGTIGLCFKLKNGVR